MNPFNPLRLLAQLASVFATCAALAASPADTAGKHSLWKVHGTNATVYLLGSVHFLPKSSYPLPEPLEAAFAKARIVAFETDIAGMKNPESIQKLMAKAMLPSDRSLKDELSAKTYEELNKHLESSGLPAGAFDQFRPGMVAMTLTALELKKMGLDPELGVDQYFDKKARTESKKILALETLDFQMDMITSIMGKEGEAFLHMTLRDVKETKAKLQEMISAWRTGNQKELEALLNEALKDSPDLYKKLLTDRNQAWVPKLEELIRGKQDAVVIVGAGHLVGKGSVVELLQNKGFKVTQQ